MTVLFIVQFNLGFTIFNHSTADIRYVFHQFIVLKKQLLRANIDYRDRVQTNSDDYQIPNKNGEKIELKKRIVTLRNV